MEPVDAEPAEVFARRLLAARDRLADRFADMDPGDLLLVLACLLRPPGLGRRFFLRELRPGVHVP